MSALDFSRPQINLIPRVEIERRRRRRVSRRWTAAAIIAAVLAVLMVAGAWAWNLVESQRLEAESDKTGILAAELRSYEDISGALRIEGSLMELRRVGLGAEAEWTGLHDRLAATLPAAVQLSGFRLATGPATGADLGPAGTLILATAEPGSLTAAADALRADDAVDSITLTRSELIDGITYAEYALSLTSAVNSGRYLPEEAG